MDVGRNGCPAYSVTLSWDSASPDRDVSAAVRVEVANPCKSSEDLEDSIEADNCVLLRAKEEQQLDESTSPPSAALELRFSLQPDAKHAISGFTVLSEARNLELYDSCNDYVSTVRSVLVDRVDQDFVVYRSDVRLDRPLTGGCMVKFLSLRSHTEMWLYGGLFLLSPLDVTKTAPATGFGPIVARMQEQDGGIAHLSDNARRFAKLVSGVSSDSWSAANLPMLMSMLGVGSPRTLPNNRVNSPVLKKPQNADGHRTSTSSDTSLQSEFQNLMSAVTQVEERLWTRIEARLDAQEQRQNEKLDLIIELLQNRAVPQTLLRQQDDHLSQSHDTII